MGQTSNPTLSIKEWQYHSTHTGMAKIRRHPNTSCRRESRAAGNSPTLPVTGQQSSGSKHFRNGISATNEHTTSSCLNMCTKENDGTCAQVNTKGTIRNHTFTSVITQNTKYPNTLQTPMRCRDTQLSPTTFPNDPTLQSRPQSWRWPHRSHHLINMQADWCPSQRLCHTATNSHSMRAGTAVLGPVRVQCSLGLNRSSRQVVRSLPPPHPSTGRLMTEELAKSEKILHNVVIKRNFHRTRKHSRKLKQ